MMWLGCSVLLCLVLFSTIKAQSFYITAPNSLRVGSDQIIGIAIDGRRKALVNFYIQDHPEKRRNITQLPIDVNPGVPKIFPIHLNPKNFPPGFLEDKNSEKTVSLTAHSELFHKEIILPINFNAGYVFIQTDKPVYTPRDRAHFRIVVLGEDIAPSDKTFIFQIKNPQNIVVEETTYNKKPRTAFTSHKYIFPTHAIFGTWSATVKFENELAESTTVHFEFQEYVLPTFTVELKTEDVILESSEFITISVKAKYVHGEKVKGSVKFRLAVQGEIPEAVIFGLLDAELEKGSHILRLNTNQIKKRKDIGWFPEIEGSRFVVEATVTDEVTGNKEKAINSILFSKSPFVFSFKRSLSDFKPGLISTLEADVKYVNGKPASGIRTKITATVNNVPLDIENNIAISNEEGKVFFRLQPDMHHESVSIKLETIDPKYKGSQAVGHHVQYKFNSKNDAFLALERNRDQTLKPGDVIMKIVHFHPLEISDIYYMVVSKGQIIAMNKLRKGRVMYQAVEFQITYEMVPSFRLVVFAHYRNELLADSLKFDVQSVCHPDAEVTIETEFHDVSPGANGKIRINSKGDTLVGLLGIDEAVYALSKGDLLTKDKVFNAFEKHDSGCGAGGGVNINSILSNAGIILATNKYSPPQDTSLSCNEKKRRKRDITADILSSYSGKEKDCCLLGMNNDIYNRSCENRTDIVIRYLQGKHENCSKAFLKCCLEEEPSYREDEPYVPGSNFIERHQEHIFEKNLFFRSDFKEVWIFKDIAINAGKKYELLLSLPHSITTWVIHAISVSPSHGICVAEPKNVVSFKKIFLQLDLPYSVVRNEQIEIAATVFNYGDQTLHGTVYMYGVEHLCTGTAKGEKSDPQYLIVEGQSAVTATFPVIPLAEGEFDIRVLILSTEGSDAVTRKLHVVLEGYREEIAIPIRLDPSNLQRRKTTHIIHDRYTDTINERENLQITAVKLHMPEDFVPGTESCIITALGDQLGPAVEVTINNPDKLLQKPRGCGEQNMMFLAPTLYTMKYLKVKGKITPEIEEKGYAYIRHGYSNQLAFRKADGSYSAFKHSPPSIWLTAFVMKVLCQANELVHIDENVLHTGVKWLLDNQQDSDGSYIESHPMYHLNMMGGVQGNIAMTAFALIALEECNCDVEKLNLVKARALTFLELHLADVTKALPVAIVAYALSLGDSHLKRDAHEKLLSLAKQDEDANTMYWDTGNPARNIEATAYGLLNLLRFNDMVKSSSVVNWLNSQQLQSGSFQSTQDTVIGLQALSEYAIRSQMPSINLVINVTSSNDKNFHQSLVINEDNAMILQTLEVKNIGGTLIIKTRGYGIGSLFVTLMYSVNRPPQQNCKFNVTVNVEEAAPKAKIEEPLGEDDIIGLAKALESDVGESDLVEPPYIEEYYYYYDDEIPESKTRVRRQNPAAKDKLIYEISICVRYFGENTAEMSIVEVGLFSGFQPEVEDLKWLQKSPYHLIQRYETTNRGITLYLATIPKDKEYCFSFHVTRKFTVGKTQASVIKVYDYYNPDISCTMFYSPSKNSTLLNTICDENRDCQCAEGGCPTIDPFKEIRKIQATSERRKKLLDAACDNYHYVWRGRLQERATKDGIFLNIKFIITKVIKEGTEKEALIEGETRTLLLRDICSTSEPLPDAEYLIMGQDGKRYKDDHDGMWHYRYMLDKKSVIYLWTPANEELYRDLKHVTRKLDKYGCKQ
ncbi:ophiophagus venom factor-like [Stegodyphus dumicola]|uniref:ophiophagus venom factor-like n=1 Tax=Stegodyphus dumicola TaxID=202533 RepID=UPI0015AC19A2|nr:ophiophagus venom factor-like [Stegodyphus dumicola]